MGPSDIACLEDKRWLWITEIMRFLNVKIKVQTFTRSYDSRRLVFIVHLLRSAETLACRHPTYVQFFVPMCVNTNAGQCRRCSAYNICLLTIAIYVSLTCFHKTGCKMAQRIHDVNWEFMNINSIVQKSYKFVFVHIHRAWIKFDCFPFCWFASH